MQQPRNRKICLLAIVGALLFASNCKSHQMNISNTWTLPQDGFTVFYRFFRDKISWYEADAVCQFHHANLVTVDNGVKYDASRAYLSDLNVTENIWIGLMRSQNSDRFMWSNSKILDREFGYWAEQIPQIDSPLCAVVDPMRDYRWHSLRCGGPDVASFLCEMEAPDWATDCLIRALPSLSIQYQADSATVELSRDCGAEGIKRLTCNGKQDQDLIQRELMCMSERQSITNDNEMRAVAAAADNSASDAIDDAVAAAAAVAAQSDNMENNSIDKIANQIEASVDKLNNDKYNLDEVMMGDAPVASPEQINDDDHVKPMKSMKKIASDKPLKNQPKQMRKMKSDNKDDIMMGDQPAEEIVPHVKKTIDTQINAKESAEQIATTPKTLAEIVQTTVGVRNRRETEIPEKTSISAPTTTENPFASAIFNYRKKHKEITHDHFLPPMLLVQHQNSTQAPIDGEATTLVVASSVSAEPIQSENQTSSTQQVPTTTDLNDFTTIPSTTIDTSSTTLLTTVSIPTSTPEATTVSTTTIQGQSHHEHTKTNMMRPHAPKFGGEISYHAPHLPSTTKAPADELHGNETIPASNATETTTQHSENATISGEPSSTQQTELAAETSQTINGTTTAAATVTASPSESTSASASAATATEAYSAVREAIAKRSNKDQHKLEQQQQHQHQQQHKHEQHQHEQHNQVDLLKQTDEANTKHADFTNANLDYQQFKPNRKRILTKPETHTYIQKIFG